MHHEQLRHAALLLLVVILSSCGQATSGDEGPDAAPTSLDPASTGAQSQASESLVKVAPDDPQLWEALGERPLELPSLTPGEPCPWQPPDRVIPELPEYSTPVLGADPIYLLWTWGDDRLPFKNSLVEPKLEGINLLMIWAVAPEYDGPFLVRARRLDELADVPFYSIYDSGPQTDLLGELRVGQDGIETYVTETGSGWRKMPTGMLIRSPGCYALQVDGLAFSNVIIIEAVHAE